MNICDVSITLLPEFGWSISNQVIYGPGSVFQGSVNLYLSQNTRIERIRLAFHANESIPCFEVGPGLIRTTKKTIFGVQNHLWECKGQSVLFDQPKYNYPFIIQMPSILFPPSVEHQVYVVQYQLIAIVDTVDHGMIRASTQIKYLPFIETNLLKAPLVITEKNDNLEASVRLYGNKYLPGEPVNLYLLVKNESKRKGPHFITVHVKIKQVLEIIEFSDVPDFATVVASISTKLLLIETEQENQYTSEADLSLPLSSDITPTFDYGKIASISYFLNISIEKKGRLAGILNYKLQLKDIPVTIGTLGTGVRSSDDIQVYTSVENNLELLPKFLKTVEYEDALPLYESARLPTYEFALETL